MTKQRLYPLLALAALSAGSAQAYDLSLGTNIPPITVHGFASRGTC